MHGVCVKRVRTKHSLFCVFPVFLRFPCVRFYQYHNGRLLIGASACRPCALSHPTRARGTGARSPTAPRTRARGLFALRLVRVGLRGVPLHVLLQQVPEDDAAALGRARKAAACQGGLGTGAEGLAHDRLQQLAVGAATQHEAVKLVEPGKEGEPAVWRWRARCPCFYDFEIPALKPAMPTDFATRAPAIVSDSTVLISAPTIDDTTGLLRGEEKAVVKAVTLRGVITREQELAFSFRAADPPEHCNYHVEWQPPAYPDGASGREQRWTLLRSEGSDAEEPKALSLIAFASYSADPSAGESAWSSSRAARSRTSAHGPKVEITKRRALAWPAGSRRCVRRRCRSGCRTSCGWNLHREALCLSCTSDDNFDGPDDDAPCAHVSYGTVPYLLCEGGGEGLNLIPGGLEFDLSFRWYQIQAPWALNLLPSTWRVNTSPQCFTQGGASAGERAARVR